MDYTRFTGFRGGRGGARGGFGGTVPSSRIPDGGRTPVGIPQGGRTPAWGMAAGSRSKRHFYEVGHKRTNMIQPQHMEARQHEHQPGSRMACLADVRLLMAVEVVQPSIHTPTAHEQLTEASRVV